VAAKEILAEVFKVRREDVDEMIRSRFEDASMDGLWPREFWLEK